MLERREKKVVKKGAKHFGQCFFHFLLLLFSEGEVHSSEHSISHYTTDHRWRIRVMN